MKRLFITLISVAALFAVGCDKTGEPKAEEPQTNTEAAEGHEHSHAEQAHAPTGYEPGTWEDWCGGHGVPESMCTRCNPSLIAGFKATGDWCDEHELPKSQCLACDPNLKIERPPKKAN